MARSLLPLCLLGACDGSPREGEHAEVSAPRRIVFISLDPVRADALDDLSSGAYPNLAAIANEGARFDRFYAASTYTIPSHMAMLTVHRAGRRLEACRADVDGGERLAAGDHAREV